MKQKIDFRTGHLPDRGGTGIGSRDINGIWLTIDFPKEYDTGEQIVVEHGLRRVPEDFMLTNPKIGGSVERGTIWDAKQVSFKSTVGNHSAKILLY